MYYITSLAPNCVMERITEIVRQGGKEMAQAQEAAGHAASSLGKHRQLNVRVHAPSSILFWLVSELRYWVSQQKKPWNYRSGRVGLAVSTVPRDAYRWPVRSTGGLADVSTVPCDAYRWPADVPTVPCWCYLTCSTWLVSQQLPAPQPCTAWD